MYYMWSLIVADENLNLIKQFRRTPVGEHFGERQFLSTYKRQRNRTNQNKEGLK